jgi:hypothetical protein
MILYDLKHGENMSNDEKLLKSLRLLMTNIVLDLSDRGAVALSKTCDGLIIKENQTNNCKDQYNNENQNNGYKYIYIKNEYVDINKLNTLNLKNESSLFKRITPIDELFETIGTLLIRHLPNKSIEYGNALNEIKELLQTHQHSMHKPKNKNNNIPVPKLKGKIVYQLKSKNERYILLKDYQINTKIIYEEPMVNNLSKLWDGHKLHRNFVVIKSGMKGYNILCEFDIIGVRNDTLFFFEIKKRAKFPNDEIHFLEKICENIPHILDWLTKNNYTIKYVAPVMYLKDDMEFPTDKLNVVKYSDVLRLMPIEITKIYRITPSGNFDPSNPIESDITIFKDTLTKHLDKINGKSSNNSENLKNTDLDKLDDSCLNISINPEYYKKMVEIINNTELFNSTNEFIEFAFKNAFNTIELLKK